MPYVVYPNWEPQQDSRKTTAMGKQEPRQVHSYHILTIILVLPAYHAPIVFLVTVLQGPQSIPFSSAWVYYSRSQTIGTRPSSNPKPKNTAEITPHPCANFFESTPASPNCPLRHPKYHLIILNCSLSLDNRDHKALDRGALGSRGCRSIRKPRGPFWP